MIARCGCDCPSSPGGTTASGMIAFAVQAGQQGFGPAQIAAHVQQHWCASLANRRDQPLKSGKCHLLEQQRADE